LHGGSVRPALPIVIHSAHSRLAVRALVDSGADYSILPKSYANYLGVDLSECVEQPCTSAGGTGTVLVHPVPLEAEIQALDVRFAMRSAFSEQASTILLGREDFFKQFRVTIDEPAQTFTIERL
jgi:gag-polyprotein putative aspartyl protease